MRLTGSVFSKTLDMDTGITVVTPNILREGDYKVVYLLHGVSGDSRTWLDYSLLPVYASSAHSVFIMPDAARSFYTNMSYGFDYYTYITDELPEICENTFRISSSRENTAIMGGSMGGYGALKCALSRPDRYGMCAAFSSGCLFLKEGLAELREHGMGEAFINTFGKQLARDFAAIFSDSYDYKPEYDILALAQAAKACGALPELYLTCGDGDFFINDHLRFCGELDKEGVPYSFEHWDAQHNFVYFNEALRRAIEHFGL